MIKYVLVVAAMAVVDACWTRYMIEVQARRAVLAGLWSAALVALSAYVVVSYVNDYRAVIAAAVGAFVGTAITVRKS